MFKRFNFTRFRCPTRVFLSPKNGAASKTPSLESLEIAIRHFTQSGSYQDTGKLKSLLDELVQCDDPRKVRLCKEACRLAHTAGYHARCAELFFSCRTLAPLPLSETVINAAAFTTRPEYLQKCLSVLDNADLSQGASTRGMPPFLLLLLRIYWQSTRCFVRIEHSRPPARSINNEEVVLILDAIGTNRAENLALLAQYRAICEEAFLLLHLPGEVSFDSWWSKSKRLVLYHAEDEGEADVYAQLFSWWERHLGAKSSEWFTPICLVCMMRSCFKAERWDFAIRYAALAEAYFLSESNSPDDPLLQQTLIFFGASMQSTRGAVLIRRIRHRFPEYTPSIPVLHSAVRVAGDVADEELAVWCLQALLSETQPIPPSSQDIFPCLIALAKCRATNFKKLLHALEESGIIQLTEEEHLHLDLLFIRHSVFCKEELGERMENYLAPVTGSSSSAEFSVRNVNLLLYILQECEHPGFMNYYTVLGREFHGRETLLVKAQWVAIALKWAMSQPALEHSDYKLLVKEAHALLDAAVDGSSPVSLSHNLKSKLRTRLGVVEQLWGKGKRSEEETAGPKNMGDISLARFLRHRHRLPRVRPPEVGNDAFQRIKLWRVSDVLASLSQRDWREVIQQCR
ncbi:hypothetical protein TCSYLVIO_004343 [Trypanosoma cruzi]|nr:hypothetical protein TCSYLVIO_004343 [Trypanosoma cruzi]